MWQLQRELVFLLVHVRLVVCFVLEAKSLGCWVVWCIDLLGLEELLDSADVLLDAGNGAILLPLFECSDVDLGVHVLQ